MGKDFVAEGWQEVLAANGLGSFDAIWRLDAGWFEPRNERRGGWSGVSRYRLTAAPDSNTGLFIKRQQNHQTPSLAHPWRGVPTFARELRLIQRYRSRGIPTLDPVYFAARRIDGDERAILITRELAGFFSMADLVENWLRDGAPPRAERRAYLAAIAGVLRRMHDQGIVHNCFFPKHVFVRRRDDLSVEVRIIDLEKSRFRPLRIFCVMRDLFSMIRHTQMWSRSDRLFFYLVYRGERRLSRSSKHLWRWLDRRARRKGRLAATEQTLRVR